MVGKFSYLGFFFVLSSILTQCQTLTLDMRKAGTLPQTEIEGAYVQEVIDACTEVFGENDYRFVRRRGPRFLYEKEGTMMDVLKWGGFSSETKVVERLSVHIRELGADSFEVECEPFIVSRPDDYMEESRKINRLKVGKYQKMLDAVRESCQRGGLPTEEIEDWDSWD